MGKAQPSLFIFNEDSHIEGIMHYNTALNNQADPNDQWQLENTESLDEELDEDEDDDDFEDEDDDFDEDEEEDEFDFDFDEDDAVEEEDEI